MAAEVQLLLPMRLRRRPRPAQRDYVLQLAQAMAGALDLDFDEDLQPDAQAELLGAAQAVFEILMWNPQQEIRH